MQLPRALAAGVVTAALLPVGSAGASPAPAQSGEAAALARRDSRVTIHPFYHHQKYRQTFRISGQVRYSDAGNVYAKAGAGVTLWRRPAGSGAWSRVGRDKTSHTTKPTYAFRVRARSNSTYRVRFAGTKRLQPSTARTKVSVHRNVVSQMRKGNAGDLKLAGQIEPAWRHRAVRLVKRGCRSCSWHVVRRQRTGGRSRFTFDVGAPRTGSWYFRVQVPGTTRFAPSISATYRTFD